MRKVMDEFNFNDYCLKCGKVSGHRIELEGKNPFGVCEVCGESRAITALKEIYFKNTDLWVTQFKIGNIRCAVAGRLLTAIRRS